MCNITILKAYILTYILRYRGTKIKNLLASLMWNSNPTTSQGRVIKTVSEKLDALLHFLYNSCAFCSPCCRKMMSDSMANRRRCRSSWRWHPLCPDPRVRKMASFDRVLSLNTSRHHLLGLDHQLIYPSPTSSTLSSNHKHQPLSTTFFQGNVPSSMFPSSKFNNAQN